jgi:hypothetical protein
VVSFAEVAQSLLRAVMGGALVRRLWLGARRSGRPFDTSTVLSAGKLRAGTGGLG